MGTIYDFLHEDDAHNKISLFFDHLPMLKATIRAKSLDFVTVVGVARSFLVRVPFRYYTEKVLVIDR